MHHITILLSQDALRHTGYHYTATVCDLQLYLLKIVSLELYCASYCRVKWALVARTWDSDFGRVTKFIIAMLPHDKTKHRKHQCGIIFGAANNLLSMGIVAHTAQSPQITETNNWNFRWRLLIKNTVYNYIDPGWTLPPDVWSCWCEGTLDICQNIKV